MVPETNNQGLVLELSRSSERKRLGRARQYLGKQGVGAFEKRGLAFCFFFLIPLLLTPLHFLSLSCLLARSQSFLFFRCLSPSQDTQTGHSFHVRGAMNLLSVSHVPFQPSCFLCSAINIEGKSSCKNKRDAQTCTMLLGDAIRFLHPSLFLSFSLSLTNTHTYTNTHATQTRI